MTSILNRFRTSFFAFAAMSAICASTLLPSVTAGQTNYVFVDDDAPAGGDGVRWATAYNNLSVALRNGPRDAVFLVAHGTYRPSPTGISIVDATFNLGPNQSLIGGYLGNETAPFRPMGTPGRTILDGDVQDSGQPSRYARHVVTVNTGRPGRALISRVRITNGNANGPTRVNKLGGGILFLSRIVPPGRGNTLDVTETILEGNVAESFGGGICAIGGTLNMDQCFVEGNGARELGGGVYLGRSGAGFHDDGRPERNSHIYNVLFKRNAAATGGGMAVGTAQDDTRARHLYMNCIFDSNGALDNGGGLFLGDWARTSLANSTFSRNVAVNDSGGGLYLALGHQRARTTIANCISWGNRAPVHPEMAIENVACGDIPALVAYNNLAHRVLGTGFIPACGGIELANFYLDPLFSNPHSGGVRPGPGSPSIDAGREALGNPDYFDADNDGDRTELIPVDFAGQPRVSGGTIDQGAVETRN
ncbi:MAG: hypothetical protein AAF456_06375 [Planctomycetota bacterium]